MVNKYIECGWGVALAIACAVATAAPGSLAASGLSGPGLAAQFDDGAGLDDASGRMQAASTAFTLDGQTAQALAASDAAQARRQAQSVASAFATSDAGSTAALQLQLWNLVANVRAQQTGNQFESVIASSAHIDSTLNEVPAVVPLPPASWLFLGGLAAVVAMHRGLGRRGGVRAA